MIEHRPAFLLIFPFILFLLIQGATDAPASDPTAQDSLVRAIQENVYFPYVKQKAKELVKTGFNAGDGYGEVWIRDYNTFIELSCELHDPEQIKENLRVFFRLQGDDGNIVDGFIPKEKANAGYHYRSTELEPHYAGHKNTVETDQESSLIQAIYKYIQKTGDRTFLDESIGGVKVAKRMEMALEFLMNQRYDQRYGLLWGATTADWGDVQPEHEWGVYLTDSTHKAIDIYDNAMFIIALDDFMKLIPEKSSQWQPVKDSITAHVRQYLWDESHQKFKPHLYLKDSPFPDDFPEDSIYYHGGTAIAIEAGLLNQEEISVSLQHMIANVKASGAPSIGLTLYPPYPEGYFKNKIMSPYSYQNGGDWSWFGGRMIQQLVKNGMVREAYEQLQPMVKRVKDNQGFYEWYTRDNQPQGSGTYRGSAGVLYQAVQMLEQWAEQQKQNKSK